MVRATKTQAHRGRIEEFLRDRNPGVQSTFGSSRGRVYGSSLTPMNPMNPIAPLKSLQNPMLRNPKQFRAECGKFVLICQVVRTWWDVVSG